VILLQVGKSGVSKEFIQNIEVPPGKDPERIVHERFALDLSKDSDSRTGQRPFLRSSKQELGNYNYKIRRVRGTRHVGLWGTKLK
jgi:hypothetical protein